jgi:hypothetical protein
MRTKEEISNRVLEMHAFLQHGLFVVESGQLSKKEERESMKLLYQLDAEIELIRWVLGLSDATWFDELDKPACAQYFHQ